VYAIKHACQKWLFFRFVRARSVVTVLIARAGGDVRRMPEIDVAKTTRSQSILNRFRVSFFPTYLNM